MSKKTLWFGSGAAVLIILFFVFSGSSSESESSIMILPEEGKFVVDITTSGALEAKNSVKITGPSGLRNYRIWNVTIQDIIDEGTFVKKGQYVAKLDPSEVTGKLKDSQLEVDQQQSQYTQTRLDTTLTMREARDNLINLEYGVRERKLTLDQSQFEPPATIQKAEIELEKAKRSLQQAEENYKIKQQQNVAKMQEVTANLRKETNDLEGLEALALEFTIIAPEDGMLIYTRGFDGKALKAGGQIGAWNPVVATLPDLSKMLSKTFVNEVDIRKVAPGQIVEIGFDAFPDKKLSGEVIKVANVGEQRPNSDAKVFAVEVEVFGSDELLKPGMTTGNRIITKTIENGLFIPLECLRSQNDSITYVYKRNGMKVTKQEVIVGDANSDNVLILKGITKDDKLYLSDVSGMEDESVVLLPELDGLRNKKEEEPIPSPRPQRRGRPNS